MSKRTLVCTALTLAASFKTAHAAGDDWCKAVRPESGSNHLNIALDLDQEPQWALPAVLQTLCHPGDAESRGKRPAIEAARQRWMKRLLLSEADWATEIVAWANLSESTRYPMRTLYPTEGLAWSTLPPIEQWAILRTTNGKSDAFALQPGAAYYLADALPLSELGRLGFIERCIFLGGVGGDAYPVEWATCQADIDALDLAKLAGELRGEAQRPVLDRMAVRFALHAVQRQLPKHAAKVQALTAKDPAYARLFELARAARTEWADRAASRAPVLGAVLAMDDARATDSQKAMQGCSERAWPLFAAAVGKLPAKRFENLRGEVGVTFLEAAVGAIAQDPDAYLAANALVACEGSADHLLASLVGGLSRWSGFRGPRTAAITAIRLAGIAPDKRGETIEIPAVALRLPIGRHRTPEAGTSATGVIAKVVDQGATVRVSFPATAELQDHCTSRRTTNRIARIEEGGRLVYEVVCTQWTAERVDTTPKPIDVPKRYAAGLAAKRFVSIVGGVPEAVWAKAASATPLAAFGAQLN